MINCLILECTNKKCKFRYPTELGNYSTYCPICGESVKVLSCEIDNGYTQFAKKASNKVECALDNIRSAYNVGSIFRSGNAFAINHLYLCGFTPTPEQAKVKKTSLGAEKTIQWSSHPNALDLAYQKKHDGAQIFAIEAATSAHSLLDCRLPRSNNNILFVVGNEIFGIDPEIRELCDDILQIPILGQKKSLNVATAFSIAAFYFTFLSM